MEGAGGANRNARYAPQTIPSQQYTQRDMNSSSAIKQEGYTQPSLAHRTPSMPLSPGGPPGRGADYNGDGDGDVRMEDADQYGKARQTSRAGHQRLPSAQLAQEESSAARRYSPMNLSPSSPYAATPQQGYQSYSPSGQSRLSPTRSNSYISPTNHYYASPPSRLDPANTHTITDMQYSFSPTCSTTTTSTVHDVSFKL
jgi:dual specificity protein kinase YAK1